MVADSGKEAVANGREHGSGYSGMCQKYVRDPCWRAPSLYGSAIEAWNGAADKHPGDRNPPVGAPCYYRGGSYGHAVISTGSGNIRSTDCTYANDISEVDIGWPERSWGYEYLGWTGDINGVDLPIGEDEDMPLSEDDVERIAQRVNGILGDFDAEGDPRDGYSGKGEEPDAERADVRLRQLEKAVARVESKLDRLAP